MSGANTFRLAVDPATPIQTLASTEQEIKRSVYSGVSWATASTITDSLAFTFDPSDSQHAQTTECKPGAVAPRGRRCPRWSVGAPGSSSLLSGECRVQDNSTVCDACAGSYTVDWCKSGAPGETS